MKRQVSGFVLLALGCAWLAAQEDTPDPGREVTLLTVQDAIGPATSDYIVKGIAHAEERGSELVVIEMDTPGGLDTAMREIIQAILGSSVPVATYVYPQGARAASAGTYILYASHVAAMAPATNTGAATPVAIGGSSPISLPETPDASDDTEDAEPVEQGDEAEQDGESVAGAEDGDGAAAAGDEVTDGGDAADGADDVGATPATDTFPEPATATERKAVNDAVAYILSLAEQRGRNAEWAERAVRAGESISAQAALENNVIDVVAEDLADLLAQIDGRSVSIGGEDVVLETEGLLTDRFEPDWRTRLLAVITNPTVAYGLMLLGMYGLLFEGYNPGAIIPGVVGAISLLLALFAFQILPVNYAGLALMALGLILHDRRVPCAELRSTGFWRHRGFRVRIGNPDRHRRSGVRGLFAADRRDRDNGRRRSARPYLVCDEIACETGRQRDRGNDADDGFGTRGLRYGRGCMGAWRALAGTFVGARREGSNAQGHESRRPAVVRGTRRLETEISLI